MREGASDDDGVPRRQAGELAPELAKPSLIPVVLVLRRELVALLHEFAQVGAVQVLEDVEEAVDEEGVVLDELVVLGDLPGGQQPQLRVDGLVPLRHRGAANPTESNSHPAAQTILCRLRARSGRGKWRVMATAARLRAEEEEIG